ncbi:hypothetical protein NIES2134_120200 [Thermostichus vulcanus NIES-2134]|nr:hypothetical protein NIES2134_120200 [Thermostichus vulcanus NIES-2134]
MVELTPAAIQELERLQAHGVRRGQAAILRIQVQPSECGDWRYDLALVAEPKPTDLLTQSQGWTIAIAAEAAELLRGLRVDYIEDLMGGAFRFHNPNASQTCGCGMAFRVSRS